MTLPLKEKVFYFFRMAFLYCIFLWQDLYIYFKRKSLDPSIRLDGKLALVTGANRGIGFQIARDLYYRGAKVILACRDYNSAVKVASELADGKKSDPRLIPLQLDLRSLQAVRSTCASLLSRFSELDILINNAGMVGSKTKTFTTDGYEETCQVNFLAPCLMTYYLMPLLSRVPNGSRVVMVSSEYNLIPINFNSNLFISSSQSYSSVLNYAMTKFALNGTVIKMSGLFKNANVTINAVHPGCVKTDIVRSQSLWITRIGNKFQQIIRGVSPKTGAQGPLFAAIDPSMVGITGQYFIGGLKFDSNKRLKDEKMIKEIWNFLEPFLVPIDYNHN